MSYFGHRAYCRSSWQVPYKIRTFQVLCVKALAAVTDLAAKHWPEIINGMNEVKARLRRLACIAALEAGLNADIAALTDS